MSSKRKRKESAVIADDLAEQTRLEKVIFSKQSGLTDIVRNESSENTGNSNDCDSEKKTMKAKKIPAWFDEDDSKLEIPMKLMKYSTGKSEDSYPELLSRQYQQYSGNPAWANLSDSSNKLELNDDVDELMRCGNLLGKSTGLPKDILSYRKLYDLNKETRLEGSHINAVEFHPTATVALIAGSSGIATIVQVSGLKNSKLQTIKFRDFPINCAHFSTNGEEFIVGSKNSRSFFYYDMLEGRSVEIPMHHAIGPFNMFKFRMSPDGKFIVVCGKYGTIHLLSAKTKEWICDLQMNNHISDVAFSSNGSRMYSYSDNGEIFEWDMKTRQCVRKMYDEGCIRGISVALSNNGQILATGSSPGIVNIYEMPAKNDHLSPSKIIKNLVTSITDLTFNSTNEILAIASNNKKNALRLVHFPSMTVFSNFPGLVNIGHPRICSFSPLSGYFAVGNAQHSVMLYRLKNFKNY